MIFVKCLLVRNAHYLLGLSCFILLIACPLNEPIHVFEIDGFHANKVSEHKSFASFRPVSHAQTAASCVSFTRSRGRRKNGLEPVPIPKLFLRCVGCPIDSLSVGNYSVYFLCYANE